MAKNKPDGDVNAGKSVEARGDNIADTTTTTAGVVDGLVKDASIDVRDIPDLDAFLIELRDRGLIGLANYNNGTMYYVPEDAIGEYEIESGMGSIKIDLGNENNLGTKAFAEAIGSMTTQSINKVCVLDHGDYVETTKSNKTFDILDKHPQCIKISGLYHGILYAKRLLVFVNEEKVLGLNFLDDNGLPTDLSNPALSHNIDFV